ncbi:MAG: hypothetical protein F4Y58_02240 [Gammaproteobacteria bacterium]|nr:hypothetical protein [Gammaproteobacteria bacterium]
MPPGIFDSDVPASDCCDLGEPCVVRGGNGGGTEGLSAREYNGGDVVGLAGRGGSGGGDCDAN